MWIDETTSNHIKSYIFTEMYISIKTLEQQFDYKIDMLCFAVKYTFLLSGTKGKQSFLQDSRVWKCSVVFKSK